MFFQRSQRRRIAGSLYAAVVAVARSPVFFTRFQVADTVEGRLELIVLHMVLVLRRLSEPDGDLKLRQALVDFMAADLDRSIRELGVGDLSVGKYMKRLGEGIYGRAEAYHAALIANSAAAVEAALIRNVYAGADPGGDVLAGMRDYLMAQASQLAGESIESLRAGELRYLPPPGDAS